MDEEVFNFVKKRVSVNIVRLDSDENSDEEDENDEEEKYVYLKIVSFEYRFFIVSEIGRDKLKVLELGFIWCLLVF